MLFKLGGVAALLPRRSVGKPHLVVVAVQEPPVFNGFLHCIVVARIMAMRGHK